MKQIAQIQIAPAEGFKGLGTGILSNPGNGVDAFAKIISASIGLMTIVAFLYFIYVFIIGAIGFINSGGDKQAYEKAKHKITHAISGIIVTIAAIFLVQLIAALLGIPNILSISGLFNQVLKP